MELSFESKSNVVLKSSLLEFLLNQLDRILLIYFWWFCLNHQYPAQYQITVQPCGPAPPCSTASHDNPIKQAGYTEFKKNVYIRTYGTTDG